MEELYGDPYLHCTYLLFKGSEIGKKIGSPIPIGSGGEVPPPPSKIILIMRTFDQ